MPNETRSYSPYQLDKLNGDTYLEVVLEQYSLAMSLELLLAYSP